MLKKAVLGHWPKILAPADNGNVPSTERDILLQYTKSMLKSCQSNFGLNKFDYYAHQPGVYYTQQTVSNLHPVCRIKRSRHLDLALFASKAAALIKFQTQTVFAVADTRRSRLMYKLNNRVDAYIERLQQRGSRVAFARLAQTILIICTAFPHVFSSHSVVNFYPLRSHPAFSLALTCDESERERARGI
jgi:hypothetical protein